MTTTTQKGQGLEGFSTEPGPTGALRWINLCVPEIAHAKIADAAARMGVSVERLYVLALDHLLKVIADADTAATAQPAPSTTPPTSTDQKDALPISKAGVAAPRRQQPPLPQVLPNRHRNR